MVNLIDDPWIPVVRRDGTRERVAPWEITGGTEPVIRLDAPRPDFNGALIQLLIGLTQMAIPPGDNRDWRRRFKTPPPPGELKEAFTPYSHAFNFDGDGPRFMQDYDLNEGVESSIDRLLMEMPGEQTLKLNTDHFLKRGTVNRICRDCCAMALFTLQTNAPSGGRGHRTSLRGGGPLTTLVTGTTLWETVWLNVLSRDQFEILGNVARTADPDRFPWMGPTRTSSRNETTSPIDVHPAQVFFSMPRRIRIDFDRPESGNCDICGCGSDHLVSQYSTKDSGVNYKGGWKHPLTPYYQPKNAEEPLPKHGQADGISYRNWLGLVQNDPESRTQPALGVQVFRNERQRFLTDHLGGSAPLWAFGFKTDNMKVVCWNESTMPLIHVDEAVRERYESVVTALIKTADLVAGSTRSCIRKALFGDRKDAGGNIPEVDSRFWQETESEFYAVLEALREAMERGEDTTSLKLQWLSSLSREAEALFDVYSQADLIGVANPRRIALSRRMLRNYTSQRNKKIRDALDLPKDPEDGDAKPGRTRKRSVSQGEHP
ncbi:type I-E CRISPR-associated protein Cse1/CasA [Methanoculleus sp. Wushi-C6]|uniref:Type I-E CRISPR-associated protein Cse1/CasA n=1 Tax=Methanoculleus caldifontis TaxID=2651577 RepID=A0ABU3X2D9_9EURY|nr:type I-E CRISPR-associated protein Cse1/CasA [Methanoculleus sp. Wushi-C6]MDV2482238.1 type I-E CRISPR-associated protein Cse1/CasA [Methanoculleus sp. Wushi-C6]